MNESSLSVNPQDSSSFTVSQDYRRINDRSLSGKTIDSFLILIFPFKSFKSRLYSLVILLHLLISSFSFTVRKAFWRSYNYTKQCAVIALRKERHSRTEKRQDKEKAKRFILFSVTRLNKVSKAHEPIQLIASLNHRTVSLQSSFPSPAPSPLTTEPDVILLFLFLLSL